MADLIYNSFKEYMADGTLDLDNDSFAITLHTSSYSPSATHSLYSDLTNELSTSGGYTSGGAALTSVTWVKSGGTVTFDADNPSWGTSATFSGVRYAVIRDTTAANEPLVCLFDFASDQAVSSGTFQITFNASGILTLT